MNRQDLTSSDEVPLGWVGEMIVSEDAANVVDVVGFNKRFQAGHVAEPKDADFVREGGRESSHLSCDFLDEFFGDPRCWDRKRGVGWTGKRDWDGDDGRVE